MRTSVLNVPCRRLLRNLTLKLQNNFSDAERCDGGKDMGADRNLWVKVTKKRAAYKIMHSW